LGKLSDPLIAEIYLGLRRKRGNVKKKGLKWILMGRY